MDIEETIYSTTFVSIKKTGQVYYIDIPIEALKKAWFFVHRFERSGVVHKTGIKQLQDYLAQNKSI